ncbi:MAG: hypothetical protein ACI9NN_000824 [Bacteroidia bacterium]|jgi:hypothetical protein
MSGMFLAMMLTQNVVIGTISLIAGIFGLIKYRMGAKTYLINEKGLEVEIRPYYLNKKRN